MVVVLVVVCVGDGGEKGNHDFHSNPWTPRTRTSTFVPLHNFLIVILALRVNHHLLYPKCLFALVTVVTQCPFQQLRAMDVRTIILYNPVTHAHDLRQSIITAKVIGVTVSVSS